MNRPLLDDVLEVCHPPARIFMSDRQHDLALRRIAVGGDVRNVHKMHRRVPLRLLFRQLIVNLRSRAGLGRFLAVGQVNALFDLGTRHPGGVLDRSRQIDQHVVRIKEELGLARSGVFSK